MALSIGEVSAVLGLDTTKFEKGFDKASNRVRTFGDNMSSAGKKMKGFGTSMSALVTAPIVGAGVAAIKFSMDFNKSMANVATLIPGNTGRVNELKTAVQDMAVGVGKSTSDISGGLYQVISAFGDTKDTVKVLEINVKAATAGLSTTTDAINLTSAVTKGYGDTTAEAVQHASDLAFQTVKLGQTTFPELAASIGRVVPVAATLGVKQEELFAGFATLTGVTGSAAEVSTQLSAILRAMMKPTDGMTAAIHKLGFKTSEAMLKQLGMVGSLNALMGTTSGTKEEVGKLFGRAEALNAVFALTSTQAGTFSEKLKAMGSVSGSTAEAFNEQQNGVNKLGATWDKLKVKVEVAAQKLGDRLAPALSSLMDQVTPLVGRVTALIENFSKMDSRIQGLIIGFISIAAAIGPILIVVGSLISAVGSIISTFSAASAVIADAGGAMAVLTGPVGIAIAVITALAGAAYLIYKNWDKIGPYFKAAWDEVSKAFSQFWEWAKPYVNKAIKLVSQFINNELNKIKKFWDENGEQITQALKNYWGIIKKVVDTGLKALKLLWDKFGPQIIDSAKIMWDGIKNVIDGALDIILGFVKIWSALFTGDWEGFLEGIKRILRGAWKTIKGIFETAFSGIIIAFENWVNDIGEKISNLKTSISDKLSNIKDILMTPFGDVRDSILNWFEEQKTKIVNKLDEWWDAISIWFSSMPGKIEIKLNEWADTLQKWATKQKARNMDKFQEWEKDIRDWFSSIPQKITDKLSEWEKSITNWFSEIPAKISSRLDDWWKTIKEWFNKTKNNIAGSGGKLEEWWTKISNWFSEIPAKITAKFEEWWTAIKDWFTSVPEKPEIKNAGKNIIDKVAGGTEEKKQEFIDRLGKLVVDVLIAVAGMAAITAIATGKEIAERISEGVSKLPTLLYNVGRDAITSLVRGLKSVHISLPHIKTSWHESLMGIKVPSFNVKWYEKGGIFNTPSIIGVGEKGPEAVVPLDKMNSVGTTNYYFNITGNTIASSIDIDRIGDQIVSKLRREGVKA